MKFAYALSNLCKVISTRKSHEALIEARELCGGHGFLLSNLIVGKQNDADPYKTFGGDNTLMYMESAKHLIRAVVDWPLLRKINGPSKPFLKALGKKSISLSPQSSLKKHFQVLDNLRKIFEYRQTYRQWKLARTLNKRGKDGVEEYVIHGSGSQQFLELSSSAAENMIMFCFYSRFCNPNLIKKIDRNDTFLLKTHCQVAISYGINCIRDDAGFFLQHGLVSSKSFNRYMNEALTSLSRQLLSPSEDEEKLTPLEEIICFPQAIMERSPLAHSDYVAKMLAGGQDLPSYATSSHVIGESDHKDKNTDEEESEC